MQVPVDLISLTHERIKIFVARQRRFYWRFHLHRRRNELVLLVSQRIWAPLTQSLACENTDSILGPKIHYLLASDITPGKYDINYEYTDIIPGSQYLD